MPGFLTAASRKAIAKSECEEDYYFCFAMPDETYMVINANKNASISLHKNVPRAALMEPRSEIIIDQRYLFGLF
nr:hypothetical protein [Pseudomonas sp. BIGb0427]